MKAHYELLRDKDQHIRIFEQINTHTTSHVHSNLEILFVNSGKIIANINDNVATLNPFDMAISLNYDVHSFFADGASNSTILIIPNYIVKSFMILISEKTLVNPFIFGQDNTTEIAKNLQNIIKYKDDFLMSKGYCYAVLGDVLGKVELINKNKSRIDDLPHDILIYINENFLKQIKLKDIADAVGYNRNYVSRFFNKYFGSNINSYINNLRINDARWLIENENYNIAEVALHSGFDCVRTFNRVFKREMGISPTQYIENQSSLK